MKTRPNSRTDLGRRAAQRFIPRSVATLSREQAVDYGAVLYARGLAAGEKYSAKVKGARGR